MIPGIIMFVLSGLLFLFAYLLYFKEAYWLISGINTSPRQNVRDRYDLTGLTRFFGRICALIGLVLFLSGFSIWFRHQTIFALLISSMFLIVPAMLFGSERYILEGKKTQRKINIIVTAFMGVVALFVIAMIMIGSKAPDIYIEEGNLVIDSMYGTEISLDSIRQMDMADLTGKDMEKRNGFDAGDIRKGYFQVDDIGGATVFQQGGSGNFIRIQTEDRIYLINLGSDEANHDLYSLILDAQNK